MSDESELPATMGKVARRELALRGLTRLEQVDRASVEQLLAIHGVGPKAIRIFREHLGPEGRDLAP